MITYLSWVAKAITAMVAVGLAEVARLNLDVSPWVLIGGAMLLAGLAVFAVPNGANPRE